MLHLEGLIAATYTPIAPAGGVDCEAIGPMVDALLERGVDGLFVGGSTGEGMSLTTAERQTLASAFVTATAGRLPVIVHVGHNCLADAVELSRHAAAAGVDAVAATCPSYYPLRCVDTLVDCMVPVAAAAGPTPFYYYHIPALTGVDLPMPDFLELAAERIPNLAGLKFSQPALDEYQRCVELAGGAFDILWGCDETLLSALAVGARGAVGSTYNVMPFYYRQLLAAFAAGDWRQAAHWQSRAVEFIRLVAKFPFHPAMKQILAWQGVDCGLPRLPMPSLTDAERLQLWQSLNAAGFADLLAAEWAAT